MNGNVWHRRGGRRFGGVLGSVAKVVVAADVAASFGSSEVCGITGNVEYHASGVVAEEGVWVGGAVVKGTCRAPGMCPWCLLSAWRQCSPGKKRMVGSMTQSYQSIDTTT